MDRFNTRRATTRTSTDNLGIASYVWTVEGPGGPMELEGVEVSHLFSESETYTVTLVVIDIAQNSDEASFKVEVTSTVEPPNGTDPSGDDGNGGDAGGSDVMFIIIAVIIIASVVGSILYLRTRDRSTS